MNFKNNELLRAFNLVNTQGIYKYLGDLVNNQGHLLNTWDVY